MTSSEEGCHIYFPDSFIVHTHHFIPFIYCVQFCIFNGLNNVANFFLTQFSQKYSPNNVSPACIFTVFKYKISFFLIFGAKSPEKYYSGWFLVLMIGNLETWVGKIPARYKIYFLFM